MVTLLVNIHHYSAKETRCGKAFDINLRSLDAMRSCGLGHSARFRGMMNMPQPLTRKNFSILSNSLKERATFIAERKVVCLLL